MLKRIKAAVVPVVLVAAVAGAAGYRAQDSGSGRRLDELSQARPAAASHFPVDGAVIAASQAADVKRWVEGFQARQAELFFQAAAAAEAEQAAQAAAAANAKKKPAAPTGRGGSTGGGSSVGGACGAQATEPTPTSAVNQAATRTPGTRAAPGVATRSCPARGRRPARISGSTAPRRQRRKHNARRVCRRARGRQAAGDPLAHHLHYKHQRRVPGPGQGRGRLASTFVTSTAP